RAKPCAASRGCGFLRLRAPKIPARLPGGSRRHERRALWPVFRSARSGPVSRALRRSDRRRPELRAQSSRGDPLAQEQAAKIVDSAIGMRRAEQLVRGQTRDALLELAPTFESGGVRLLAPETRQQRAAAERLERLLRRCGSTRQEHRRREPERCWGERAG